MSIVRLWISLVVLIVLEHYMDSRSNHFVHVRTVLMCPPLSTYDTLMPALVQHNGCVLVQVKLWYCSDIDHMKEIVDVMGLRGKVQGVITKLQSELLLL